MPPKVQPFDTSLLRPMFTMFESNDIAGALRFLNMLTPKYVNNPYLLSYKAVCLENLGHEEEFQKCCDTLTSLKITNPGILNIWGSAFKKRSDFNCIINAYEDMIQNMPMSSKNIEDVQIGTPYQLNELESMKLEVLTSLYSWYILAHNYVKLDELCMKMFTLTNDRKYIFETVVYRLLSHPQFGANSDLASIQSTIEKLYTQNSESTVMTDKEFLIYLQLVLRQCGSDDEVSLASLHTALDILNINGGLCGIASQHVSEGNIEKFQFLKKAVADYFVEKPYESSSTFMQLLIESGQIDLCLQLLEKLIFKIPDNWGWLVTYIHHKIRGATNYHFSDFLPHLHTLNDLRGGMCGDEVQILNKYYDNSSSSNVSINVQAITLDHIKDVQKFILDQYTLPRENTVDQLPPFEGQTYDQVNNYTGDYQGEPSNSKSDMKVNVRTTRGPYLAMFELARSVLAFNTNIVNQVSTKNIKNIDYSFQFEDVIPETNGYCHSLLVASVINYYYHYANKSMFMDDIKLYLPVICDYIKTIADSDSTASISCIKDILSTLNFPIELKAMTGFTAQSEVKTSVFLELCLSEITQTLIERNNQKAEVLNKNSDSIISQTSANTATPSDESDSQDKNLEKITITTTTPTIGTNDQNEFIEITEDISLSPPNSLEVTVNKYAIARYKVHNENTIILAKNAALLYGLNHHTNDSIESLLSTATNYINRYMDSASFGVSEDVLDVVNYILTGTFNHLEIIPKFPKLPYDSDYDEFFAKQDAKSENKVSNNKSRQNQRNKPKSNSDEEELETKMKFSKFNRVGIDFAVLGVEIMMYAYERYKIVHDFMSDKINEDLINLIKNGELNDNLTHTRASGETITLTPVFVQDILHVTNSSLSNADTLLIEAFTMLQHLQTQYPNNSPISILLLRLAAHPVIANTSKIFTIATDCENIAICHIQYESLGYLLYSSLIKYGHFELVSQLMKTIVDFYTNGNYNNISSCDKYMSHQNYKPYYDMALLMHRLNTSMRRICTYVDSMMLKIVDCPDYSSKNVANLMAVINQLKAHFESTHSYLGNSPVDPVTDGFSNPVSTSKSTIDLLNNISEADAHDNYVVSALKSHVNNSDHSIIHLFTPNNIHDKLRLFSLSSESKNNSITHVSSYPVSSFLHSSLNQSVPYTSMKEFSVPSGIPSVKTSSVETIPLYSNIIANSSSEVKTSPISTNGYLMYDAHTSVKNHNNFYSNDGSDTNTTRFNLAFTKYLHSLANNTSNTYQNSILPAVTTTPSPAVKKIGGKVIAPPPKIIKKVTPASTPAPVSAVSDTPPVVKTSNKVQLELSLSQLMTTFIVSMDNESVSPVSDITSVLTKIDSGIPITSLTTPELLSYVYSLVITTMRANNMVQTTLENTVNYLQTVLSHQLTGDTKLNSTTELIVDGKITDTSSPDYFKQVSTEFDEVNEQTKVEVLNNEWDNSINLISSVIDALTEVYDSIKTRLISDMKNADSEHLYLHPLSTSTSPNLGVDTVSSMASPKINSRALSLLSIFSLYVFPLLTTSLQHYQQRMLTKISYKSLRTALCKGKKTKIHKKSEQIENTIIAKTDSVSKNMGVIGKKYASLLSTMKNDFTLIIAAINKKYDNLTKTSPFEPLPEVTKFASLSSQVAGDISSAYPAICLKFNNQDNTSKFDTIKQGVIVNMTKSGVISLESLTSIINNHLLTLKSNNL